MGKRKKNVPVAVEEPASGGEVVASDLSPEAHMANLKDLNRLLLKDTVELREQIHQHRSELAASAADRDILNETERDVCGIVLYSSLSDAAARSTAEMDAAAETAGKMLKKAESVAAELNAAEMRLVVVAREKDRVERDLERVTEERDLSRSGLDDKCKDYVDLEERFRLMSTEREVADAKCGKLEEEGRRMKGELQSVMREKDLLERSREDAKHLVEKFRTEMEVLKSQKDVDMDTLNAKNKENASKVEAFEEECRLLKETIGQLENEVGDLKVSSEERKDENLKEKLELEKAFDMKEKEMILQINELKKKMTMIEGEKNLVENQIRNLQAEISELQTARKSLEDVHSSCCEKIAMKESYCADMQRENNLKAEEIEFLQMQLNESLKNLHIMEITIEQLQRELNRVTAENEEAKKQIDCSKLEKASLKKHLETSNQRLQDVEKKLKALEDSPGQAFALLRTQENHINRENGIVEVDNDDERKLFVDNLEAIKVAVKRKETIIKDLTQKLELLQLSVAHANNKMRIWKWLFPATTGIFAAASLAYAARQAR